MSDKFTDTHPPWKDWTLRNHTGERTDAARICAYCGLVMAEGSRPASHGICPTCEKRVNDELDAQYGDAPTTSR